MADGYFTGQIILFSGSFTIKDFLPCDGRSLPVSQYPALYSLLGNIYGGNTQNFNLPDLRGRLPIHQGQGPGLTERNIGQKFGQENVPITVSNMSSHTHAFTASAIGATTSTPGPQSNIAKSLNTNMYTSAAPDTPMDSSAVLPNGTGSAPEHYNMMPYLAMNYQICINGIYPSRP